MAGKDELLTLWEAAERMNVPYQSLYAAAGSHDKPGRLPVAKWAKAGEKRYTALVLVADVEKYLATRGTRTGDKTVETYAKWLGLSAEAAKAIRAASIGIRECW